MFLYRSVSDGSMYEIVNSFLGNIQGGSSTGQSPLTQGLHDPSLELEAGTSVTSTSRFHPIQSRIIIPAGTTLRDVVASARISHSVATSSESVQVVLSPQTMRIESTGAGPSGTKPLLLGRDMSPVRSISSQGSGWIEEYYGNKGEASSSSPIPPQPAQEIHDPVQPHAAQDIPQGELNLSLMNEDERRNQLTDIVRICSSLDELDNYDRFQKKVQTFVDFERELERGLCKKGFLPETINNTRMQIRDIVLYSNDKNSSLLKESTINNYLSQMRNNFNESKPFTKLIHARDKGDINLYKPGEPLFYFIYF